MFPTRHDPLLAADQTLQALEALWAPPHPDWAGEKFYGREALPLPAFIDGMSVVGEPSNRSFLDVGCGVGSKVHLTRMLGWTYLCGFDIYAPYVEAARILCPWPECDLSVCDAYEFTEYTKYDVVYMYRLCVDDKEEKELEHFIASRMKPGSLAFFPHGVAEVGRSLGCDVWEVN